MFRQNRSDAGARPAIPRARLGGFGRYCRSIILALIAVLPAMAPRAAGPVELPGSDELQRQSGVGPQSLTVVEPHESVGGKRVVVTYSGFPIDVLLTQWFGEGWRTPSTAIVFEAADGYRSVIESSRLSSHRALLAAKRADDQPFVVDNPAQRQQRVPLGPYYLVWDNRDSSQLQALGTQGWPYQVVRISLQYGADQLRLIPSGAPESAKSGFADTKEHCLNCHQVRGVGGNKFPVPLEQVLCRWSDADLAAFIADPARFRPGSTMPALDGGEDPAARADAIRRMVNYLAAIRAADSACSNEPNPSTK
jgi:cytochrome c2